MRLLTKRCQRLDRCMIEECWAWQAANILLHIVLCPSKQLGCNLRCVQHLHRCYGRAVPRVEEGLAGDMCSQHVRIADLAACSTYSASGERDSWVTYRDFCLELRQSGHELARWLSHLEQKGGGGHARATRVLQTITLS